MNQEPSNKEYKIYLEIFLIFLIFVTFWATVFHTYNENIDIPTLILKYDAWAYYEIAGGGYSFYPCEDGFGVGDLKNTCGNVGWFPFYPVMARLFSNFMSVDYAMFFVSAVSFLISLMLLQKLVSLDCSKRASFWAIAAICTFPTSFYFLLGFPYSLFLLLSLSIFLLLRRKRPAISSVFEALLLTTYPSGILIYIPKVFYFFKNKNYNMANILLMGVPLISLFFYFLYNKLVFGDFLLYIHYQSKWGHHLSFPLWPILKTLELPNVFQNPESVTIIIIINFLFIFFNRLPIIYWLYGFAILLFTPTMGTTECIYRQIIVAFPIYIALATSKRHWSIKFIYCLCMLIIGVIFFAKLYINDELV